VIYADAADKAARFVMDCSQTGLPLLFVQDVMGFMVGPESEQEGIIRRGAKLVSAVSNCATPKITLVAGGSFGAGNYALCGKAFDPTFIFAWPNARYAAMGASQAPTPFSTFAAGRTNGAGRREPKRNRRNCSKSGRPTFAMARPAAGSMRSSRRTRHEDF
jgi:acetyl-CoA carboxylase carboxyltransferase component